MTFHHWNWATPSELLGSVDEHILLQVQAHAAEVERVRMDGATMRNLDILQAEDGTLDGTLLQALDRCETHSGQRLLRAWLCRPLGHVPEILRRQAAVLTLAGSEALRGDIQAFMQVHKDLPRCVAALERSVVACSRRSASDV